MKRFTPLLLSAALLLGLLGGCQAPAVESSAPIQEAAVTELADEAFFASGQEDTEGLEGVSAEAEREWIAAYLENSYGLQDPWEDGAIIRATGASAFEIAVLRMADEDAAGRAAAAMTDYLTAREGDFTGYAPAEADMAANGKVLQAGPYAALFICPDPDGAYQAVEAVLRGDKPLPGPEPSDPGAEPSGARITGVKELRDLLVSDQGMDGADLEKLDDGDPDALRAYIESAYGLAPDQWEECAIARGTGDSAFEVAVFRFPGSSSEGVVAVEIQGDGRVEVPISGGSDDGWEKISNVESRLTSYLDAREASFDSATEQAKLLHRAIVISAGEYAVLLACEDWSSAAEAFSQAAGTYGFGWSSRYRYLDTDPDHPDRCKFTAPNNDDMSLYDTSAIRAAWEKGDPAGLSDYDRKIYDQARKVLDEVLEDGMSGYEKELAVYEWVVNNVDYDWTHQDHMKTTPRESFTPYGGLVNRTAVCLGYATTFQLLMDLAGVECITVPGAAFSSQEDHGWNMVRLNGAWYCVDATWDANYREQGGRGRPEDWNYFNVTSDYMADRDHQWDYANTPEATAEDQGQG